MARPVVISGMSVIHRGADGVAAFDELLRASDAQLRAVPVDLDAGPATAAAPLDSFTVEGWSSRQLDGAPDVARRLRAAAARAPMPSRTAACAAVAAVRAACLTVGQTEALATIVAGSNLALNHHAEAVREHARHPASVRASHILDCFDVDAVGAVTEALGSHGEAATIGAASASGSVAFIHAARLVGAGLTERCLVVAPANELSGVELCAFARSGAMVTLRGDVPAARACRPFDEDRAGFGYCQVAAAVVLEPRAEAVRRGVRPLAQVLGYGQRVDGRRDTAPSAAHQAAAMREALDRAGLTPADVDYVNAHATGSIRGDEAEARALHAVFGARPWINATKGLIGHGLGAAGLVEIVATVLQIDGGYRHGNPHLAKPLRGDLRFAGAEAEEVRVRRALSNSFAFGGINTAVALGRVGEV